MAKTRFRQTNFTAGMLGKRGGGRLLSRVDLAKYYNGASQIINGLIYKTGGVTRRPGLRHAGSTKYNNKAAIFVRFEFNVAQAYVLEFGDQYIRFWKNGALIESSPLVPYEISSPYLEAELFTMKFQQSASVLYIGDYPTRPPAKLSRVSDTSWTLSVINFRPPAAEEKLLLPAATLTLGATSGNGVTATASVGVFLSGDKDRLITSGVGRAVITAFTSSTVVTVDILDAFSAVGPIAANSWGLDGSPSGTVNPDKSRPQGGQVTITSSLDAFRAADVGKYIRLLGGLVKITAFTSATEVKGEILNILKDAPEDEVDPNATPAWTLQSEAWGSTDGYPSSPLFHEGRLLWARRQDIWGSKSDDFENHATGSGDDDAIHYALSTNTVDYVEWLASDDNKLYAGTAGGVHSFTGGGSNDGEPLTPDPPRRRRVVSDRCSHIVPIVIDGAIIFPERSRLQLKEIRFDWEEDKQRAWELTDLHESILASGVKQMAYQSIPDPRHWIVREDGKIVTLTYYRKEDVIGWAMIETDGLFESIAIIPHPDGRRERVNVLVSRVIDGTTRKSFEYFDDVAPEKVAKSDWPHVDADGTKIAQLLTDCAVVVTPPAGTTHIMNLTHLTGKQVRYFVNNAARPMVTVDETGAIDLQFPTVAGDVIEIGLPFTHTIETIRPEIPNSPTIQGLAKRWSTLSIRVLDSVAARIQGVPVPFTKGGDPMDSPPPLFTGDKLITDFGITEAGTVTIEDDLGPFTLLMVYGNLHVGE